ncbi:MAG: creatininase family protein [Gemmatimonadota bacterium]|nr:creatininase family protein [Gemmatimonadota bacterium]
MARSFILSEATLTETGSTDYQVAVLPWGATEAHNYHLPYSTDNYQAVAIAEEAARLAQSKDSRVVVLPAIPFGANAQQLEIPMTINLNPSSQFVVLQDIVASLETHGVERLVILNGHGGNDFRWMVRELQETTSVFMCVVDWYRFLDPGSYFDEPGDHAGEMETSLMMHLHPDLVKPLTQAGSGAEKKFKIEALREGRAWAPRHWPSVTDDTGVGNPSRATAKKGETFFSELTLQLSEFLVELASADLEDLYQ